MNIKIHIVLFDKIIPLRLLSFVQGTPILQGISNECHYEFEWPTNIMCPTQNGEWREKTCEIHNSQINHSLNLQDIFKNGLLKVEILFIELNDELI